MIQPFDLIQANLVPSVSSFSFYAAADIAGLTVGNAHNQTTPTTSTSATLVFCPAGKQIIVRGLTMTTVGGGNSFVGTITDSSSADAVTNTSDFITFACNKNGPAYFTTPFLCGVGNNLVGLWCTGNTGSATSYLNTVTFNYNVVDA